jgi:hypothetical protein
MFMAQADAAGSAENGGGSADAGASQDKSDNVEDVDFEEVK